MRDKVQHFVICAFVAWAFGMVAMLVGNWAYLSGAVVAAIGSGICLGAGKEMGDLAATGNRWDWGDFLADVLGTLFAVIVLVISYFAQG